MLIRYKYNLFKSVISLLLICIILSPALASPFLAGAQVSDSSLSSSAASISGTSIAGTSLDGASLAGTSPTGTSIAGTSLAGTSLLDPAGTGSPAVEGKAYVLYDAQSGTFLIGKDQDKPLSPASITKVMTILLVFDRLKLEDEILITRDMIKGIPSDYMLLGLIEGEVITVEQALYACLLISANDAAKALAVKMGGTEKDFAVMMNAKAVELGCTNTNFTNSYGYSDKKHLTTARDMALIMAEALKNEIYTRISTTRTYTVPVTNKSEKTRLLINSNRFISTAKNSYEYYIGGKTGFTNMSGFTITAGARKNGRTLISVILGATVSETRYANLISLFNYGFSAYDTESIDPSDFTVVRDQAVEKVTTAIEEAGNTLLISNTVLKLDDYITTTMTKKAGGYTSGLDISIDITPLLTKANLSNQVIDYPLYRQYADGSKNQVGNLEITIAKKAVPAIAIKPESSIFKIVFRIFLSLIFALVLLTGGLFIYANIRRNMRRRRRRRRR